MTPPDYGDSLESHYEKLRREELERFERARYESFISQIPRKYRGKHFEDVDPREGMMSVPLLATVDWCKKVIEKGAPMLALLGPAGTGKSMLLYAAAQLLYTQKVTPYLIRWWLFSDALRYGRGSRDERDRPAESAADVRAMWHQSTAPCMIDEFRFTSSTDHDATEMAKYALTAYDDDIPVMITGNNANLVDMMGNAPADRFTVITLEGESYR